MSIPNLYSRLSNDELVNEVEWRLSSNGVPYGTLMEELLTRFKEFDGLVSDEAISSMLDLDGNDTEYTSDAALVTIGDVDYATDAYNEKHNPNFIKVSELQDKKGELVKTFDDAYAVTLKERVFIDKEFVDEMIEKKLAAAKQQPHPCLVCGATVTPPKQQELF